MQDLLRAAARLIFALLVLLHAIAGSAVAQRSPSAALVVPLTNPVEVTASEIKTFGKLGGSDRRHGRLTFRGGLVLTSPASEFGGFSGIELSPDGRRFIMVSDEQGWFAGEITYDQKRPTGLTRVRHGDLLALNGRVLTRKRDADAESVVLIDGTLARGTLLIAFERNQRIGRFPIREGVIGAPLGYLKQPVEARQMRSNKGFEAVAVLQGGPRAGAPIAFAEKLLDPAGHHTGWLWIGGEPRKLALTDIGDYEITDAKSLPDGDLLILERRFRWLEGVKMRLRLVRAADIQPGAVLTGDTLTAADMGYEIDNMEGLAVHRGPSGEIVLTMISDNNYNSLLQRTLLLQFTLEPDGVAAAPPTR